MRALAAGGGQLHVEKLRPKADFHEALEGRSWLNSASGEGCPLLSSSGVSKRQPWGPRTSAARYSSSVTCSIQVTGEPFWLSWRAMWVMASCGVAPCQCFCSGGHQRRARPICARCTVRSSHGCRRRRVRISLHRRRRLRRGPCCPASDPALHQSRVRERRAGYLDRRSFVSSGTSAARPYFLRASLGRARAGSRRP